MNIQETIEKAPYAAVIVVDRAGIPDAMKLTATDCGTANFVNEFRDEAWPDARYLLLHRGLHGTVYWACSDANELKRAVMRVFERLPADPVPWFLCASGETAAILKPLELSRRGSLH